jgi:hypothetical protein
VHEDQGAAVQGWVSVTEHNITDFVTADVTVPSNCSRGRGVHEDQGAAVQGRVSTLQYLL